MDDAERDDQEDHLEEGDEEVGGGEEQTEHPQDGGSGSLHDGDAQGVEGPADALVRSLVRLGVVVVRDVGGEVDGETDAHDEVDEGDAVKVHAPPAGKGEK